MNPRRIKERNAAVIKTISYDCAKKVRSWLDLVASSNVLLISGRRSLAEQQVYWHRYQNGGPKAAKPGESYHQYGEAIDYVPCVLVDGQYNCDFKDIHKYEKLNALAKNCGLAPILDEYGHLQNAKYETWRDIPGAK